MYKYASMYKYWIKFYISGWKPFTVLIIWTILMARYYINILQYKKKKKKKKCFQQYKKEWYVINFNVRDSQIRRKVITRLYN